MIKSALRSSYNLTCHNDFLCKTDIYNGIELVSIAYLAHHYLSAEARKHCYASAYASVTVNLFRNTQGGLNQTVFSTLCNKSTIYLVSSITKIQHSLTTWGYYENPYKLNTYNFINFNNK